MKDAKITIAIFVGNHLDCLTHYSDMLMLMKELKDTSVNFVILYLVATLDEKNIWSGCMVWLFQNEINTFTKNNCREKLKIWENVIHEGILLE